jgi:hypothetical protein
VGGAEGEPAAAEQLVDGVFFVAGDAGDLVAGGARVDAFVGADE